MGVALEFVGYVQSELGDGDEAPKQADEGAPPATLRIAPRFASCCEGLHVGDEILVLTWLDRADREVTAVHPRADKARPLIGVFATRSPDRPNPIGLHRVTIVALADDEIRVDALEALNGTPVVDVKPVLDADAGAR